LFREGWQGPVPSPIEQQPALIRTLNRKIVRLIEKIVRLIEKIVRLIERKVSIEG
jgi:hypothetical protein